MLRHDDVWKAVDRLAGAHGMSPSGLARRSGLDPTTFNKSKRVSPDGKPRWPSTESISKILGATGASLRDFVGFVEGGDSLDEMSLYPGEAIALETGSDGLRLGVFQGRTARNIQLATLENPSDSKPRPIKIKDISWIARLVWMEG